MSTHALVFYGQQLVFEVSTAQELEGIRASMVVGNYEFYSGALVCLLRQQRGGTFGPEEGWYRMDATPMLLENVPKEVRTLALILT